MFFVNKMDQPGTDRDSLLLEVRDRLDDGCVDFTQAGTMECLEQVAMCDETVLEHFLETGNVEEGEIGRLICERKLFPCYFGSALRLKGVEELLEGIRAMERCRFIRTSSAQRCLRSQGMTRAAA